MEQSPQAWVRLGQDSLSAPRHICSVALASGETQEMVEWRPLKTTIHVTWQWELIQHVSGGAPEGENEAYWESGS